MILVPVAHLVLVNRSLRAVLVDARRARRRAQRASADTTGVARGADLAAGIDRSDLDATLLCAARSGQIDLALAALDRGGDPNATPGPDQRDQRSALIIAVTLPDLRFLRGLIAKGVDVNRANGGLTPLIAATRDSYQGRPDAVMTLLSNGADPRIAGADGNTALHHAARCAEPIVAALLLDASADIDAVNREGLTALGIACMNASWDVVDFLLDRGAKSEVARAQPALLLAAGIGDDDVRGVKSLLKHRASPNVRGAMERTALMTAALAGHVHIAEALLGAGADPNLADHRGTTALMEAARSGAVGVVHALGKRKANANLADSEGRSALIVACQSRNANEETVRALLTLGADRAQAAADGKRALDHAAASGRWHIVALLDPAYPLPSSLASDVVTTHTANADHLLDALRFGHWNVVAEFAHVVREWPPSALADLYLALAKLPSGEARNWLLNHGLGGDARLGDGRLLADALIDTLPGSSAALSELAARGVSIGGAGIVARLLASAPRGEAGMPLRALAADFARSRRRLVRHDARRHFRAARRRRARRRRDDARAPRARCRPECARRAGLHAAASRGQARHRIRSAAAARADRSRREPGDRRRERRDAARSRARTQRTGTGLLAQLVALEIAASRAAPRRFACRRGARRHRSGRTHARVRISARLRRRARRNRADPRRRIRLRRPRRAPARSRRRYRPRRAFGHPLPRCRRQRAPRSGRAHVAEPRRRAGHAHARRRHRA